MISATGEACVDDLGDIHAHLDEHGIAQVQFNRPLTSKLRTVSLMTGTAGTTVSRDDYLRELRSLCRKWGEKLVVRFYGYHNTTFDASVLLELPEVQSLVINSIYDDVENLGAIAELPDLVHLSLGVFGLKDKQILKQLPLEKLTQLTLEETETKALDLAPLADADHLKSLAIYGHKKNIAVIGALPHLIDLTLNPVKAISNSFLNGMPALRSLRFVLGSGDNIADIDNLPAIEDIALTMVRGLSDLGDLQRFPSLRRLMVQDQPKLDLVKVGPKNTELAHLWFHNCPALKAVRGIDRLSKLESLRARKTAINFADTIFPLSLTHAAIFSGLLKKEALERDEILAAGLVPQQHPDMPFGYG